MQLLKTKDLSKILEPYSNEWVALSRDEKRILSSGQDLKEVVRIAQEKGELHPIVTKVPQDYGNYVLGL